MRTTTYKTEDITSRSKRTTDKNNKIPEDNDNFEFPITLSHLDIKDLKLINTLFSMGDYEIWLDANFDNKIVESWFELRKDKKTRSAILARDAIKDMDVKPSFLSAAYKLAYPRHWVEEINIAGKKLDLDPYFIIALIKEESHFLMRIIICTNWQCFNT